MMDMVWSIIEPNVWKPLKEGDSVMGILVRKDDATKDINARYYLEYNNKQHMIWGTVVLDDKMSLVNVGQLIRITFIKNVPNKDKKKNDIKIFKVEVSNKLDEVDEEKI